MAAGGRHCRDGDGRNDGDRGGHRLAGDPVAMDKARRIYGARKDLVLCESADHALDGADALAIVTEWQEFRSPDFDLVRDRLRHPVIFDGRNIYDSALVKGFGLRYFGIGRGETLAV